MKIKSNFLISVSFFALISTQSLAAPTSSSIVGDTVTNPVTGLDTTVSALIVDPASTPTAGTTAFVETADGYVFLVKDAGDTIYNSDNPPAAFEIVSITGTTAQISNSSASGTASLSTQLTVSQYNSSFNSSGTPGGVTAPVDVSGPNGVDQVVYGQDGSNGRDGALFVPPSSGGNGATGPTQTKTLSGDVNATSNIGWQVGSVGGDGGNGGDSYLSFWDGRDGGDGGKGGTVNATQAASSTIQTSGSGNKGIFAFSRSGEAGNGGSGFAAPGGGTGGHSADGGNVTVTQEGTISTTGDSADGIYALSVSNNGGNGGSQWGLVGSSGDGGYGGNGGTVTVNTKSGASILTTGNYANGIYAQSVGGSGGSAGTSGNLLVSLIGGADNGGNGGEVIVSHAGAIETRGDFSRGIVAQSVGGGGGSGGTAGGLVSLSLGGVGSNGGSGDDVSVRIEGTGTILTSGTGADGVMAQSIGGSGGTGANSYGLVAIGGTGSRGGSGAAVSVSNFGSIVTGGDGARGIIAQSIGGGGGDGGSSGGMVSVGGNGSGGGAGSDVTIVNDGIITTTGDDAMGILAQSIGGGGGNGGSSGSVGAFVGVAIGGDGGSGGAGGDVNVTLSNTDNTQPSSIQTSGDRSTGVFAQSVGGGGGNGGGAVSVAVGAFGAASISVGGSAGDGGNGGEVTLTGTNSASVQTSGDDSVGILLQSVGGGGGNGGYAVSVAVSGGPVSGSLAVGVGGDGGTGGIGGPVTVGQFNSSGVGTAAGFEGTVVTTGNRSTGMLFQSVGGGGGNGGLAVAATGGASALFSGNVSVGLGGQAGSAGDGGLVRVYTNADITTTGTNSSGMIAQSVGGGGGNGGGSIAAGISASAGAAVGINVGVGGDGGGAGIGGDVTLIAGGNTIETSGAFSSGVVAQSVGGGGGNGGYSVGASADFGGAAAGSVSVGLGGKAGGGGAGGAVTAQVDADVTTRGDDSGAVIVQSIGGGGGNGGFSVAAGLAAGGAGAGTVDVGLGGDGGSGGIGGTVTGVRVNGDVRTEGLRSTGVVIQSIGGGGGNGGFNVTAGVAAGGAGAGTIGVGLGGDGSTGGNGGIVEGQVAGNVTTLSDNSGGVVFQSIGGGGGNGGFNVTAGIAGAGAGGGAVTVGLGGDGSGGGIGQSVTGRVTGTVTTVGADSTAVLAQSVGGGGGNGGFNVSASLAGAGVASGAVSVGLGGNGGSGAVGGTVELTTTQSVTTTGDRSSGVVAQSIGGGGGNGGFNVSGTGSGAGVGSGAVSVGLGGTGDGGGNGGTVSLTSNGKILTQGDSATAFLAQSVGGGGGNGGFNVSASVQGSGTAGGAVSVGLGGSGAGGGDGNTVIATSNDAVETQGDQSSGVVAQSIGGGGGNGGFNVSAVISGAGTASGAIGVGLGGSGDTGGDGGNVTLTSNGTILTDGFASGGFVAQSLGGGGGNGGFNVSPTISGAGTAAGSLSVGLGGSGDAGGNGTQVTAKTTANVVTKGDASVGILAQSVGGGGGNGGFNVSPSIAGAGTGAGTVTVGLGGSGGSGGNGGIVGLTVENSVRTEGAQSSAIVAQSIGGGGGNGGFNVSASLTGAGTGSGAAAVGLGGRGTGGGDASAVTANVTGNIVTLGETSTGLLTQSVGGGGGNGGMNISVAVAAAGTGSGGASVGLGGASGTGGDGGTAEATLTGNVSTQGGDSGGVIVQSLGGGGGNGGMNVSATVTVAGTGSGGASVGLGGSGGSGGNADTAKGTVVGNVTTAGDNSGGVLVQSAAGGGGNGGLNVSAAVNLSGTGGGAVGVGIGGSGGDGGNASSATGSVTGDVATAGENATGVLVQSVGGGGGNGGLNISGAISIARTGSGAAGIGVGGFGGSGGTSGVVDNTYAGDVSTAGSRSAGIVAQSLGGGGGNGATNISGAISVASNFSGGLGIGVGGFGGDGGAADNVTQRVTGNVTTTGDDSVGILTHSLGGGGGNGGTNISAALSLSRTTNAAVGIGVGGFGGGGANAGTLVQSTITGGVRTEGDRSTGILTQSLGGGGGNGGTNISASLGISQQNGGSISLGVGGFGGGAGNGGNVTSTLRSNTGTSGATSVITTGSDSIGVMAQSVGGGGGNGGLNVSGAVSLTGKSGAAVGLGLGGFGGGGGDAGTVSLDVESDVVTAGDGSHGVFAQSLGGGGGTGGVNISGTLSLTKPSGSDTIFSVAAGVGGFGGSGGDASAVDLDYTGSVQAVPMVQQTDGSFAVDESKGASGIIAQSLGGGGGNGGTNVSGGLAISGKPGAGQTDSSKSYAVVVGVGGFGGGGGDAGNVDVDIEAGSTIRAHGTGQSGLLAQSLGGGGGNGGMNVSGGIVSDSSLIVGVGGFAGDGGKAGDVTVTSQADITVTTNPDDISIPDDTTFEDKLRDFLGDTIVDETEELASTFGLERLFIDMGVFNEEKQDTDGSAGLMAQSIGGGGGNGGLNVSGGIALSKDGKIPSVTFGVGGFGGDGNVSGNVTVDHTGAVSVAGNWKHGVLAQSIAGGGGNGALNVTGQLNYGDSNNSDGKTDLSIVGGLGGHGGTGADAGDVSVTQTGNIATNGYHARGVFAQSIGGGGGTGGINATFVGTKDSSPIAMGIGGFGGGGGDAGDVTVARGTSVATAGTIQTDGVGSHGIEASSIGGGGGDAGINAVVGISKTTGSQSNGGTGDSTDRKTPTNTGVDDSVISNYNAVLDELEGKVNPADSSGNKTGVSAVIAIGGDAGTAGDGGTVDIDHYGDVITLQDSSHGIFGQSIGGGGGNAALNLGMTYELASDATNKGFGLAIGGGTGEGGIGGSVDVRNTGNITTSGADSHGLFAQSVGGGGGNAGYNSASTSVDGGNVNIQIGRTGGTGGSGGDVYASSNGVVRTSGNRSYGFFAQSIGNGGGNSSSTSISIGTPKTGDSKGNKASLSVGLEGGTGGAAGDVTAAVAGTVATEGSDAHAVFAQSVGGGGGNGGKASNSAGKGTSVALSIGGTGGTGGLGGKVDVSNTARVATFGDRSVGLMAQSIGGAGGTGGMVQAGQSNLDTIKAVVNPSTVGTTISVNIGGTGGDGMTSDTVTVVSDGIITTEGTMSHGIYAQSVGGGGGMGGLVENRIISLRKDIGNTATLSIGGNGGTGAMSAAVSVTNRDMIQTTGDKSIGIYAQSVGGGGGDAQQVRNIILGRSSDGATTNAILIGGTGGTGGSGSTVTVVNEADATIRTTGRESHGIFAQSIGGGGGNGGSTISVDGRYGGAEASTRRALQFGLGGSGGTGGTGGNVSATNTGTIITTGDGAHGIFAQSIGGGGGNGGSSITGTLRLKTGDSSSPTAQLNIGGSGGSGNVAGNVVITNNGDIRVDGAGAYGIMAQSVGGGGGNGGLAVAMDVNDLKNTMTGKSYSKIAIGGSGGDGADGGDVTVNHTGSIVVNAENGFGIYAQSVGGGGGNAGYSVSSPLVSALDYTISQALGAREGSTGTVGTVTVNSTGDILVKGAGSEAVFVQSVNGGGGNVDTSVDFTGSTAGATGTVIHSDIALGGDDVSGMAGNQVMQSHKGNIATTSNMSTALMLQSIGGGGGTSATTVGIQDGDGIDITARLGAINTDDASGGNVDGSRAGDVGTDGAFSSAGTTQSIGGGGGKLVLNSESDGGASTDRSASVILGADPSFRNDGGDINLSLNGNVFTSGDHAFGQSVQSIGAGGGEAVVSGLERIDVTLGAQDDSTGDGGSIDTANTGDVTTTGKGSHGFVLQSIGGGGGLVSTDLDASQVSVNLSAANGGDGGEIKFAQTGNIMSTGENAIGVVAQSLGGGGGIVDSVFRGSAGGVGSGGAIELNVDGNVLSVGEGGIAVFAQSKGRDGADTMALGLDGVVMGGTGQVDSVASIILDGGTNNVLTLSENSVLLSRNDQLLNASDGNDQVTLAGKALGNLDLGAGTNGLTIEEGATFYALDTVNLGAAGQMQVDGNLVLGSNWSLNGTLSPTVQSTNFAFSDNVSQVTNVTGSLAFGATATSVFDVYFLTSGASGGRSDLINVSGNATMGGTLTPQLNTLQRALPLVIINPEGTVSDAGTTIQDTVVLDYSIGLNGSTSDGSSIDLVITPDYSTPGMNANQAAIGDYINQILNGQGSAAQGELFALIGNMQTEAEVINAIDSFTTADYAADAVDAYYGTRVFAEALHNCERYTEYQSGDDPRRCVWFAGGRSFFDREQTGIYDELDINNTNLSAGFRLPVGDDLYAGFALGHDQISLRNGTQYNATGDRYNLGASLTKYIASWELAAMLSGGWSDYDTVRSGGISGTLPNGTVVDTIGVSSIKHKMNHQNLRLSLAYDYRFAGGKSYLKPELVLDATRLATESNGKATLSGVSLQDSSDMIYSMTPSLEIGTEQYLTSTQKLRASLRAGAIISSRDTVSVSAGFSGASSADGGFSNTSFIGNKQGLVSAELGLYAMDDSSFVNLNLDHMFGDSTESLQVSLGIGVKF